MSVLTLWDLVRGRSRSAAAVAPRARPPKKPRESKAQAKYDEVVRLMLATYGVRVRKWRSTMSGIAFEVSYADGSTRRLIEAPRPRGPMSAAVFLHEIGHHAIGFNRYKPRCLEEFHAWKWSLSAMEEHGLNVTDGVRHRMHASLYYAVRKAQRRGIRAMPVELAPFMERPVRKRPGGESNPRPSVSKTDALSS